MHYVLARSGTTMVNEMLSTFLLHYCLFGWCEGILSPISGTYKFHHTPRNLMGLWQEQLSAAEATHWVNFKSKHLKTTPSEPKPHLFYVHHRSTINLFLQGDSLSTTSVPFINLHIQTNIILLNLRWNRQQESKLQRRASSVDGKKPTKNIYSTLITLIYTQSHTF